MRCDGEKNSAHSKVSNAILANISNATFFRNVLRQTWESAVDAITRVRSGIQSAPIAQSRTMNDTPFSRSIESEAVRLATTNIEVSFSMIIPPRGRCGLTRPSCRAPAIIEMRAIAYRDAESTYRSHEPLGHNRSTILKRSSDGDRNEVFARAPGAIGCRCRWCRRHRPSRLDSELQPIDRRAHV